MESTSCQSCGKIFSRPDNLQSHMRQNHQHLLAQPISQSEKSASMMFQHPFTMTVSGPTGCGKTQLVKDILMKDLILPPPKRIWFLYKRWQPLYDVIAANVAQVEFVNGIPPNLDSDECLDSKVRNLLILDDLMTTSTKDTKVTDLFCEGSHHRNLSVIALNQNLYFGRDPTQRRNTQYLILFRNPVDQMPIYMLARQMYPQNARYFLDHFNKATEKPYGHLVVDLKPYTPEHARLKENVIDVSLCKEEPKQEKLEVQHFSEIGNGQNDDVHQQWLSKKRSHTTAKQCSDLISHCNLQSSPSTFPCLDCGTLFQTMYNLQKHIQQWCPVSEDSDDEPPRKKPCLKSASTDFKHLMQKAKEKNDDQFVNKAKMFRNQGLSKNQAIQRAKEAMVKHDIKTFLEMYYTLLAHILRLCGNPLHQSIVSMALSLTKEMNNKNAIKTAIKHFSNRFNFDMMIADSEDSDSEDTENQSYEKAVDETDDTSEEESEDTELQTDHTVNEEGEDREEKTDDDTHEESEDTEQHSEDSNTDTETMGTHSEDGNTDAENMDYDD